MTTAPGRLRTNNAWTWLEQPHKILTDSPQYPMVKYLVEGNPLYLKISHRVLSWFLSGQFVYY